LIHDVLIGVRHVL